jgi:hypothetical protein
VDDGFFQKSLSAKQSSWSINAARPRRQSAEINGDASTLPGSTRTMADYVALPA